MASQPIRVPPMPELVAMVATFMALNALGIDIMLPALPDIAREFGVARANDQQLILLVYMIAFGAGQLIYGPLSDSFGRRPVLLVSLAGYLAATVACLLAPNFLTFLAARAAQGATAAAARVIAVAVVRDLMAGREMARVMSMALSVFMIVPIAAPGVGQLVLLFGPWRWTFGFLLAGAAIVIAWTWARLPETRPKEKRQPFSLVQSSRSYGVVLHHRAALGYTIAASIIFGGLFSFLATAQQVFVDVYGLGPWFPLAFAAVAGCMSMASIVNARLVTRLGMRRISHAALLAFTLISVIHGVVLFATGPETLPRFMGLLLPAMFVFGMIGANFSAIVLEPMGERAGAAAAFNGFATTTVSAAIGGAIGQAFTNSPAPLVLGHAGLGAVAVLVVFVTERGRLFGVGAQRAEGTP